MMDQFIDMQSGVNESYLYDDGGQRVKKVSGGTTWYYPFSQYEIQVTGTAAAAELASSAPYTLTVPVSDTQAAVARVYLPQVSRGRDTAAGEGFIGGTPLNAEEGEVNPVQAAAADGTTTTVRRYYFFAGQRVALWTNETGYTPFRYLHADHLGSTVMETCNGGAKCHMRGYDAFGSVRGVPGGDASLATDHTFTGQKADGTGLYYYNARYYDPVIGQFVSPDTLVPEPGQVFGYNRYMYAFGNPLRFNDPSGHCKMLADGGRDTEGDKACWDTTFAIYGYGYTEQGFAENWNVSPDAWLQNIASQEFATVEYLRPFYEKYDREFRGRTGLATAIPDSHSEPPQHPLVATVEYCREHDCVGSTLNTIGVVARTIAVACASSLVGNAGCSEVASYVSFTASAIATGRTAAKASEDEATVLDLTVSVGTVIAGGVPIVGQSNKGIGFLAAVFQAAWDGGLSNRVATGGGVQ